MGSCGGVLTGQEQRNSLKDFGTLCVCIFGIVATGASRVVSGREYFLGEGATLNRAPGGTFPANRIRTRYNFPRNRTDVGLSTL